MVSQPTFNAMNWKWQAYLHVACDQFPVVRESYLDCIMAKPEMGSQG